MAPRETTTDEYEKKRTLPILQDDSSNWPHYEEIITTHVKSKGLHRHLAGTARKPADLVQDIIGDWFIDGGNGNPLTEDELEAHEKKQDDYETKESKLRDIIYQTVSPTRFSQIKDMSPAYRVWEKLVELNQNRGDMAQLNVLNQLQQMRCGEDDDLLKHLAEMSILKDTLAKMGNPLSDPQFGAYIRASIPDHYRTLMTTITMSARMSVPPRPIDTSILINELTNEYISRTVDKKIDSDNAAMSAQKKAGGSKGAKGGEKPKCTNCNKKGHSKPDCFAPGGGKEHDRPDWYIKQQEASKKNKGKQKEAGAADDDNIALLIGTPDDDDDDNVAFLVTSDFTEDQALSTSSANVEMIIDTGATRHFTPDRANFITFSEISPVPIRAADGRSFHATGKGSYRTYLPMGPGKRPTRATLANTYYSPNMVYTLISVSTLDRAGFACIAADGKCEIKYPKPGRNTIANFPIIRGLYRATNSESAEAAYTQVETSYLASKMITISEFHRRMGHVNHDDLLAAVKAGTITGVNLDLESKPQWCATCIQAKAARQPIPKKAKEPRPTEYGGKVVTDLKGKISVPSIRGAQYAMNFIDLSTHEERPYFLKKKSEAFENYLKYEAWVKLQRNAKIKILGTDNGGEFTSKEFEDHLEKAGTVHQLTVHDTPSENGIAERGQRTHIEQVRAMLIQSGLPKYLWAEAWTHSTWLRNRCPTAALPNCITPMEKATNKKPNLSKLLEWGAPVWVKVKDAGDLEVRAKKAYFVGYDLRAKGMRLWPGTRKVVVERDVYFNEKDALTPGTTSIEGEWDDDDIFDRPSTEPSNSAKTAPKSDEAPRNEQNRGLTDTTVPPIPENLRASPPPAPDPAPSEIPPPETPAESTPPPPPPHARKRQTEVEKLGQPEPDTGRGHRGRKPPGFYHGLNAVVGDADSSTEDIAACFQILEEEEDDDSDLYLEEEDTEDCTTQRPRSQTWSDAARAEFAQLDKMNTWDIVEAPIGTTVIRSHCVLAIKRDAQNKISRYKVRLVANGRTQVYGLHYTDTYAPVIRHATLRVLLTFAAVNNWEIHQADVKNAYLNAPIDETVYMEIPEHYQQFSSKPLPTAAAGRRLVAKLNKGIYGTKQGGRLWYIKVCKTMDSLDYTVLPSDRAVFISRDKETIAGVATDDFTILGLTLAHVNRLKSQLNDHFELVDLGEINWLLGIHLVRDRTARTISLSQTAYIEQILAQMGLSDAAPNLLPMEPGVDLSVDSPGVSTQVLTRDDAALYCKGVGLTMYATITHPEITYHALSLSQFMHEPRSTHLKALRRVCKYLSAVRDYQLVLGGSDLTLLGYSDASWSSRRSISGYAFYLGNSLVDWSSKKQPLVTLSTTESEYVALTHASKNLLWLRKIIAELFQPITKPTTLFSDNQAAIVLTKDGAFHARTKHIDNRFHFIRQTVTNGHAVISYCPTNDMIADIFMKSLARPKFEHFRELLGVEKKCDSA
ncbi:Retrovirus-related Pol polyprotein from transposon TNT 1-94 [Mycena sanguinolenta]|uniref:Retrovirus-related Pol polyprotein from transposon TNT 1-94 n=1 Tax=Mycena sanguinolenta TaxID=230812 RepID=A0A8H6YZQ1_9AGAR|nr:Retrovirus-related Pol polyprotein from transposon TNT 1-94 [Mycena sanguinolenta]